MTNTLLHLAGRVQRGWFRLRGERFLLTTFWPQDFRRGEHYVIDGRKCLVTRYFRAVKPDMRYFEIWGYAIEVVEEQPAQSKAARVPSLEPKR